jgi:hypothetical protein
MFATGPFASLVTLLKPRRSRPRTKAIFTLILLITCAQFAPISGVLTAHSALPIADLGLHSAPTTSALPRLSLCPAPGSRLYGNWADNETVQSGCTRGVYRQGGMEFYVPNINFAISSAQVGIWFGLGGDPDVTGSSVLVQAGVWISQRNGVQYNESFWEVAPGFKYAQNLPLCRLRAGDLIDVAVQSNLYNDGYDYFYMANVTAGCSNACQLDTTGSRPSYGSCAGVTGSKAYNSDGATGECAIEQLRNLSTGSLIPLAEWGGTGPGESWSNMMLRGCVVNGTAIGSQSHLYEEIQGSSGSIISWPNSIDSTGQNFNVHWDNWN